MTRRRSYHLGHALGLLIEASLECREFAPLSRGLISSDGSRDLQTSWKSHLDQYCTITMGTARRAGHTTALVKTAKEFFSKPLFVTPNEVMLRNITSVIDDLGLKEGLKEAKFKTAEQIKRNYARGVDCDAILVDCAFGVSAGQRKAIEEHALAVLPKHPDFCLIYV